MGHGHSMGANWDPHPRGVSVVLRVSWTGLGQEEEALTTAQNRWRAPPPAISPTPSTACQGRGARLAWPKGAPWLKETARSIFCP